MASDTNIKKTESRWLRGAPEFERIMDLYWGGPERRITGLTLRIISVNAVALLILVLGILYLGQYQNGLIATKLQGFANRTQIIADALIETDLAPERLKYTLARIGARTGFNITVFNADGTYIKSTEDLGFFTVELGPRARELSSVRILRQVTDFILSLLPEMRHLPPYPQREDQTIDSYPDAAHALKGLVSLSAWQYQEDRILLSVATPIQVGDDVLGVLLVRRIGDDIGAGITALWVDILKIFLGTLLITILLSIYLSGAIASPLRRLAKAAEAVRTGRSKGSDIPDLSDRHDEIGELSIALRAMTGALWTRMDAVESFAADVAHELKNPLTSLRSAIETLERVEGTDDREKLAEIIRHDLARMDRLITDISNASRLDAEMSREAFGLVDLKAMLENIAQNYTRMEMPVSLQIDGENHAVLGAHPRLAQAVQNLLDNAVSFSDGAIDVRLMKDRRKVVLSITDSGPGIPQGKLDNIFERFYSERPEGEGFGNHSGLGLSIVKQIVEAHGGTITAENAPKGGARFAIELKAVR